MADDNATLIDIRQLSHRYSGGATRALDCIDLRIPRGACFGLLGPNGAGKTTLLSLLTGLLRPQQGTIGIDGLSLPADAARIKARSSLVPQDYAFYPALSGLENLRFFADIYGLDATQWRTRSAYCIDVCRLHEILKHRSAHYSGGLKRRLNLAIGLLSAPQILYLDEPTVGIDALSRQVIIDAIKALRERGTTVIYTSHYMEEVEAICDELAVIDRGRVVARDRTSHLVSQGAQKTLLLTLSHRIEDSLLTALMQWHARRGHSPNLSADLQLELALSNADELGRISELCTQHGNAIKQAQYGVNKLEHIYLSLLQNAAQVEERA